MAGLAEMGLGIASVLRSGAAPNPLPVDFRAICADPAYVHQLARSRRETGVVLRGNRITGKPACRGRIEIEVGRN